MRALPLYLLRYISDNLPKPGGKGEVRYTFKGYPQKK